MKHIEFELPPGLTRRFFFLRSLAIFYIVLAAWLFGLGVLFIRNNQAFNKGTAWVAHTRTIINLTDSILLLSQNLQWESRNYTLTGDSNALQKYFPIRNSLQAHANSLIQLVNDNKNQHANAVKLQHQIIQLIQFTEGSLQLKQISKDELNRFTANVKQHVVFHEAINQQIQSINSEEYRLLALRRAGVIETTANTHRIFVASGVLIFIMLVGTFINVRYYTRKREKAENKLFASENRFQILVNSTKDLAIFMTDNTGHVVNWYAGAHNIKGYDKEEVIGKNISIFYTPESVAAGEPQHNLQLAAEHGSFETEGWRVRKNGEQFWADVLITAIYDKDGKLQGFTKVTRDFSLHKKAEDEIKTAFQKEKELNEMKSNFVSMASHEFRTPLSAILSSVSLLDHYKTTENQDKRDKHIQRIKTAVSEMVVTLEEFLSIEKIEEGKVYAKKEPFNLKKLAEEAEARFSTVLKPDQAIEYIHSGKEEVFLDEGFINHILNNLLSNAVKYSPDATPIIFETCVEETTITLKVKDHGIGISSEDQKHLFERFARASNTGKIKGTGLGLHIAKRYIDLMQGTIEVKSEIGSGSIFIVTIPSEN